MAGSRKTIWPENKIDIRRAYYVTLDDHDITPGGTKQTVVVQVMLDQVDLEILGFITRHTLDEGYPPTFEEIGNAIGYCKSGAWHRCDRLRKRNILTWNKGSDRTIRLKYSGADNVQPV